METQAKLDQIANSDGDKAKESLLPDDQIDKGEDFSGSMKTRKKYKDVADAAQAAFESAAYAAAAARAAVELSRTESHDPDDQSSPHRQRRLVSDGDESKHEAASEKDSGEIEKPDDGLMFEKKVHPIENHESESEDEKIHNETQAQQSKWKKKEAELKRPMSSSSSDSAEGSFNVNSVSSEVIKLLEKDIVFDDSDDESGSKHTGKMSADMKPVQQAPSGSQVDIKARAGPMNHIPNPAQGFGVPGVQHLSTKKMPFSMRTRGVRGY